MKKTCNILGMIVGVLTLMFAMTVNGNKSTVWMSEMTRFGADYYTESYQGIAATANAIGALHDDLARALALILASFGLFMICFFGSRLASASKTENAAPPSAEPTVPQEPDELPAKPSGGPAYGAPRTPSPRIRS